MGTTEPVHPVGVRDASVSDVATKDRMPMSSTEGMENVRNETIKFATFQPPGATLPTMQRKILVVAPSEAVALARSGDVSVLDRLIPLLDEPDRAWAAAVMLSAMTWHDVETVKDFDGDPEGFLRAYGRGLRERWQKWLDGSRGTLEWDESFHRFVAR